MLSFTLNGTFLIVLGAIWTEVRLSPPVKTAVFWIALYGTYANWFFTTLAATLGTAAANPISAAGHHGQPWQESLAGAGFLRVAIAIIVASLVVLWGLRAKAVNNACESERINTSSGWAEKIAGWADAGATRIESAITRPRPL